MPNEKQPPATFTENGRLPNESTPKRRHIQCANETGNGAAEAIRVFRPRPNPHPGLGSFRNQFLHRAFSGIAITLRLLVAALFLCSETGVPRATAQGSENTLLIVNAESEDSLAVANRYIELRDIPACNVVYLRGVTNMKGHKFGEESTTSKRFQKQILSPVLQAMKDRGIAKQIDCIAYSAGFPTRINFQPEMKAYLKRTGKKYSIHLHAPWASITSLTYFHANAFSERPDFLELDANHYANPRNMKLLANPFGGADAAQFDTAMAAIKAGDFDEALNGLTALARVHREQMPVIYPLAQCYAFNGDAENAIMVLNHAKTIGCASKSQLENDRAFAPLRDLSTFQEIIEGMEDLPDGAAPARPFSSQKYWGKNGWPSGNAGQGQRYVLCSVLAVTGKNQSTLKSSLARLESSVKADGTRPEGLVYFADHKDPRSRTRSRQFPFAVNELKSLGRDAVIGSSKLPPPDARVIGATLGSPVLDWSTSSFEFVPGAISDNFTSYGGWWEKAGQTQLSESLDAGAAGACGTVYEPYTISPKIPTARWHAHYARGTTMAESFYQSVSGPFQLLLVGDPLCCPYGNFPEFELTGIENASVVKGDFELQIEAAADAPKVRRYEMYFDGVYFAKVSNPLGFKIETEAMNDGYHEIRIVAVADTPVANKSTQRLEFFVDRKGEYVALTAVSTKVRLGETLELSVDSSLAGNVEIRQNSRVIASIASGKTKSISASKLGRGKSRLQAVVVQENGSLVRSEPLDVEVRP